MPTIDVSRGDLCDLIGRKLSAEQIKEEILFAKGEVEEVKGDELKIDIKDTNRPDLWSAEGIAREIRARHRPGMPKYATKKSNYAVNVDPSVKNVRPQTACAVIKNLKINSTILSQIIQLQEKIAGTFGSNRREVAIGIYDLKKIKFPVTYKAVNPGEASFVPLDFKDKMTLRDIAEKHPKGREYGHLLKKKYPIFADAAGEILSMPPVINSNHSGRITHATRDVFIECSGYNQKFLGTAINVLAAALHERGGQIYEVRVNYGKKHVTTPDLTPKKFRVSTDYVNKLSGLGLRESEIRDLLEKSAYDTKSGKNIEILYPAYRQDIMHEADVAEDVMISYGFNKAEPDPPKIATRGGVSKEAELTERVSRIMTGAGFQEIMSYTLTNPDNLYRKMNADGNSVEIDNPVSSNWSVFRTSLLPGLLDFFSRNKHVEYPQEIYETGTVILKDGKADTRASDETFLAAAATNSRINYGEISSKLDALLRNVGIEYTLKRSSRPEFLEGRTAQIIIDGMPAGFIGEIHPSVLNNWNLDNPVVAFEVSLEKIFRKI